MKFIIDEKRIKENYKKYSQYGRVFYPVKANSNKEIIKIIKKLFSPEDRFYISNISQIIPEMNGRLALMNPLMSDDNIKKIYEQGCKFFVFDDKNKLKKFLKYARIEEMEIALRISTMEINNEVITNLGTSLDEIKEMIEMVKKAKNIGIQFYLNPELRKKDKFCLEKILKILPYENIDFLSIGGIPNFELNIEMIKKVQKDKNVKQIIFEPGKDLIENAVSLETNIIKIKDNIVTIENGIYSGFLDLLLYGKQFDIYIDEHLLTAQPDDKKKKIYLFGGSADSADKLGIYYIDDINITKESRVLIKNVGSYFEEFFMNYGKNI